MACRGLQLLSPDLRLCWHSLPGRLRLRVAAFPPRLSPRLVMPPVLLDSGSATLCWDLILICASLAPAKTLFQIKSRARGLDFHLQVFGGWGRNSTRHMDEVSRPEEMFHMSTAFFVSLIGFVFLEQLEAHRKPEQTGQGFWVPPPPT